MSAAWPTAEEAALDGLRVSWGAVYEIGTAISGYTAEYAFEEAAPLKAATLEGLESSIRADWSRRWTATGPGW